MPSDTAFLITVEIPLKPTQIIYPFGSQLRGYLPYFLHGRLHQPRPLFASEKMYSSPSLPLLYSVFNILSLYAEEFKNKVQLFKKTRNSSALYCCFVYWWGIDKSGRDRREPLGGTAGQGYPDPQENITLGSSVAAVPVLASA